MQIEVTCAVKNGVAFIGKLKDYQEDSKGLYLWVLLDHPFMLVAEQTGPTSMKIRLQELVGDPQEIKISAPEVTYSPTAKGLLQEYLKSATGIVITQSMPAGSN